MVVSMNNDVPARYPAERLLEEDLGSWWVLHVKPNCEKIMARYLLNREIGYYFPLYTCKERVGYFRRLRTTEVPLFRGYLCVALPKLKHHLLYDSKKLVRIINVEDQETLVAELQSIDKAVRSGEDLSVHKGLAPGKRVLILNGPLNGIEGIVVRCRRESHLALSVTMFNQSVLVKLDPFTTIELIS